MKKTLTLILLPLLLIGCSHEQFRAYLLDNDIKKSEKVNQEINVSEFKVALMVKKPPDTFNLVSKSISTAMPVMKSYLVTDNTVLDKSRRDLENYYITAKHLRMSNMPEDLELFAEIVKEYLSKRIDPLLKNNNDDHSPEVRRALTELQYNKANILYEIKDLESACKTLSDLESNSEHEAKEDLKILSQRFSKISQSYLVMTEFSYKCKR